MNTLKTIPDTWKMQHLFLLVGANSLPNYVAADLLVRQGGTVHLIYTNEVAVICKDLKRAIKEKNAQTSVASHLVDNADSSEIRAALQSKITRLAETTKGQDVGLNYTGGTKVMAVHVYDMLSAAFSGLVCTYLDAKELRIVRDNPNAQSSAVFVRDRCEVTLKQILSLHGYNLPRDIETGEFSDERTHLLRTIQGLYTNPDTIGRWKQWTKDASWREEEDPEHGINLLRNGDYDSLADLLSALDSLCGGTATAQQVAEKLGQKRTNMCKKWFDGIWLEEYTVLAINQLVTAPSSGISIYDHGLIEGEISTTISTNTRRLELDVALTRGYQLFIFSCQANEYAKSIKEHLLEAYVRARQLGGDEARVGLVCGAKNPRHLEEQITDDWFTAGRIKVFGMEHLPDLKNHICTWLKTANIYKQS